MRIKKTSQTTTLPAQVVNTYSESTEDTYSCDFINNINSYSTSETFTGEYWIDGKPIYRKCVNVTTTLILNNENVVGTIQNADSFANIRGNGILSSVYIVPLPYIDNTNNMSLYCRKTSADNTNIILVPLSTNITNINIVIEYTKTTD